MLSSVVYSRAKVQFRSILLGGILFLASTGDASSSPQVQPDPNLFEIYPTHELAEQAYARFEVRLAADRVTQPRAIIASDDARYLRVKEAMRSLWEGFKKLDPALTEFLPSPEIIVVEDPAANAYAVSPDPTTRKLPYYLVVQTGALNEQFTESALRGVMAHELAHLLFQHARKEVDASIQRYFLLPEGSSLLDSELPNDELAKQMIQEWISLAKLAGPYSHTAFRGLPNALSPTEQYYSLLMYLMTSKHIDTSNPACGRLQLSGPRWVQSWVGGRSLFDLQVHLTADEWISLERQAENVLRDLHACFHKLGPDLISIIAEQHNMDPRVVMERINQSNDRSSLVEVEIFASSPDFVTGLQRSVLAKQRRMREIEADGRFSKARYHSKEDAADDISTQVLALAGFDPNGMNEFLTINMTPANQVRCAAVLNAGEVPPFGLLLDEHHSDCYRVYRMKQQIGHRLPSRITE